MANPKPKVMKVSKNDGPHPFMLQVIEILRLLNELNQLAEKTYLKTDYYDNQFDFEHQLASKRRDLMIQKRQLHHEFQQLLLTDKQKIYGASILEELDQLVLNFISLSTLRYRIGDDSNTHALKPKFELFISTLHQFVSAVISHIECPHKVPNIKLIQRLLVNLEEAFLQVYPTDADEVMNFSMDVDAMDSDLLLTDEDVVSLDQDDSFDSMQAFIYTAHLTCSDFQQLLASIDHWSN
jgi:hypothetical protein